MKRFPNKPLSYFCLFILQAMLWNACAWTSETHAEEEDAFLDSLSREVDTVAYLEPEIPSFSDLLLADVVASLANKDSIKVVHLLDSACVKLTRPVSADSLFEVEESARDVIAFLDSSRYELSTLRIDIERFKQPLRQLFP